MPGRKAKRKNALRRRIEFFRTINLGVVVDGRTVPPESAEYEKQLKHLAGSLSAEEFEGMVAHHKSQTNA